MLGVVFGMLVACRREGKEGFWFIPSVMLRWMWMDE